MVVKFPGKMHYLTLEWPLTIVRLILIFESECWTKRLEQQITTADMKVIKMIQVVTRYGTEREMKTGLYKRSNMLPIVQVINTNKL